MAELKKAPCVLEALARKGYGIAWDPWQGKFWPFSVEDGESINWWHDPEGVADEDFETAVNRLKENIEREKNGTNRTE